MTREYVRVTPSRSDLALGTVVEQLGALHGFGSDSNGILSGVIALGDPGPPTFEFLMLSSGDDEPAEFYYGSHERVDALEERLRTLYPSTFELERIHGDPLTSRFPLPEGDQTRADRWLPENDVEPVGITWYGCATRKQDWMTTLPSFLDVSSPESGHSRAPLAPLVDQLAAASASNRPARADAISSGACATNRGFGATARRCSARATREPTPPASA